MAIFWTDTQLIHRREPAAAGVSAWLGHVLHADAGDRDALGQRIALAAAIMWAPLALLAAIEGVAVGANLQLAVLGDFGAYGRYLFAAPLFVWAESVYLPQMIAVTGQFRAGGIVSDVDLHRYEAIAGSTRRLLDSPWTSILIVTIAYLWTAIVSRALYPSEFASWIVSPETGRLSFAGWWRTMVSQPLLMTLLLTALWRIALWIRFLRAVTRLDLQLVGGHPDRRGGLSFALIPLRGFTILAIAFAAIAAGDIATRVLINGESLDAFRWLVDLALKVVT